MFRHTADEPDSCTCNTDISQMTPRLNKITTVTRAHYVYCARKRIAYRVESQNISAEQNAQGNR